ncbi:aromatase/cyclase [Streptomyces sp. URMC 123]|uniref:aromatase/cyclase n=1 Tax=Streptomyces sp. URMC 123 TaxID=3423403 RepID=UPI003F1DC41B
MAPNATTDAPGSTAPPDAAGTADGSTAPARTTEHSVTVAAPPEAVFRLVADVADWPQVFGPTVHVEVLEDSGTDQLLRIWALAGGDTVRCWTSRRTLDPAASRIAFRQVVPADPVAAMGGEWRIEPARGGGSRVVLLHDYRAVGDDPSAVELIERAVDRNSTAELEALRATAELGERRDELRFTFHDSLFIAGAAEDVHAFLDRADLWPERLPHVARLDFVRGDDGVQYMDMDTRSPDGSTHTTTSVRVAFPDRKAIVYKQLRTPVAMSGHTGRWEVEPVTSPEGIGVRATSWHTVTLSPEGVRQALGPRATLAEARAAVRTALGTNSSTTLRYAKEYAESR